MEKNVTKWFFKVILTSMSEIIKGEIFGWVIYFVIFLIILLEFVLFIMFAVLHMYLLLYFIVLKNSNK